MLGQQPGSHGMSYSIGTGITRECDYRAVTRISYSPNLGWPDVATRLTEEGGLDLTPEVVRSKFPPTRHFPRIVPVGIEKIKKRKPNQTTQEGSPICSNIKLEAKMSNK